MRMSSNLERMDEPCCICGSEEAVEDDLLVYCDGPDCNIGVHQKCYGIKEIPNGLWLCYGCEGKKKIGVQVRCTLCPNKHGALKKTETGEWAHVVCAMYIPGARFFDDEKTKESMIYLYTIPSGRFHKLCYICHEVVGACMSCRSSGCPNYFHPTCAQPLGLLYEKTLKGATSYLGYCQEHIQGESSVLKRLSAFRGVSPSSLDHQVLEVGAGRLLLEDTKEHAMEPGSDATNGDSGFHSCDTLSNEVIDLTNDSIEEDVIDEYRFESHGCDQTMQLVDLPQSSSPKSASLKHVVETPRLTTQVVPKRRRSLKKEWSTSMSTTPNSKRPGRSGAVLARDFMWKKKMPSPWLKSIYRKNSRKSFMPTSSSIVVANPIYSGQFESTVDAGNRHPPEEECKALVLWHPPPATAIEDVPALLLTPPSATSTEDIPALLFTPPSTSSTEDVPPLLFTPPPAIAIDGSPPLLFPTPPATATDENLASLLLASFSPESLPFAGVSEALDISQLIGILQRLKAETRALEALVEPLEQRKINLQNEIQVLSEPIIDVKEIV